MSDITFKLDPKISIGSEIINRLGLICSPFGSRVVLVTEPVLYENKLIERVQHVLEDSNIDVIIFDEVPPQATAEIAEQVAELARGSRSNIIVGLGGLKTQAIARLASMLVEPGSYLFDLLDGVLATWKCLPYIAVPTSGRDPFLFADRFIAVDPRDRSVKTVRVPPGLCVATIIDSSVSELLPDKFAATIAFDGLCVAIEAYCSQKANFLSDAILEQAIGSYATILDSFADNRTFDLLGSSSQAGFLTALGSALSAPGIGTALAYALNGKFPVAKSWCSTVLLPHVMERLIPARPEKLARVARYLGEPVEGVPTAEAARLAVDGIRRRMGLLSLPGRLKDFNLVLDRLIPVAETARSLDFISYSPRPITDDEAYDILKQAY
ncbi:MAG: iron-containing alcohol dehydrogenase [Termitinemataceae bacterium]